MVNSIKIVMPSINKLEVNCFPSCSNPSIQAGLVAMSPCIDIVRLRTSLPLQANTGEKSDSNVGKLNTLLDFAKTLSKPDEEDEGKEKPQAAQVQVGDNIGGFSSDYTKTKSDQIHFLNNFYGFFSMMTAEADRYCYNVPIISSPQIKVNTSNGWKNEQSLLSFVKSISNSGAIGGLLNAINLTSVVNGVIDEIERIGGMAGWSPRIGPYFSLTDNPFGDKPSLNVEIKLINDTEEAAMQNSIFLDQMLRNSLIATGRAARGGVDGIDNFGTVDANSLFNTWHPPKLFNVGLKWGADSATGSSGAIYVKRYYLCTLEATVQPEGLFRKCISGGRIPDAYSVQMNFNSLMPDTLDLWSGYGFSFGLGEGAVERMKGYVDNLEAIAQENNRRRKRKALLENRLKNAINRNNQEAINAVYAEFEQNGWDSSYLEERYGHSQAEFREKHPFWGAVAAKSV